MAQSKPIYTEGFFPCSRCKSKDTVGLNLKHEVYEPYDTLIWCSCGMVTVLNGEAKPEGIYDFKL